MIRGAAPAEPKLTVKTNFTNDKVDPNNLSHRLPLQDAPKDGGAFGTALPKPKPPGSESPLVPQHNGQAAMSATASPMDFPAMHFESKLMNAPPTPPASRSGTPRPTINESSPTSATASPMDFPATHFESKLMREPPSPPTSPRLEIQHPIPQRPGQVSSLITNPSAALAHMESDPPRMSATASPMDFPTPHMDSKLMSAPSSPAPKPSFMSSVMTILKSFFGAGADGA